MRLCHWFFGLWKSHSAAEGRSFSEVLYLYVYPSRSVVVRLRGEQRLALQYGLIMYCSEAESGNLAPTTRKCLIVVLKKQANVDSFVLFG